MNVNVLFHGGVKEYTSDEKSFEAGGTQSVRMLIELLGEHFGADFKDFLLGDDTCFFLVNGNGIMTTGGLSTLLSPGDTVEVLPFVEGG